VRACDTQSCGACRLLLHSRLQVLLILRHESDCLNSVFHAITAAMNNAFHLTSAAVLSLMVTTAVAKDTDVLPALKPMIGQVTEEFDQIPAERQLILKQTARFIRSKLQAKETPQLTFICTHNSRRSHLAQIWAQTAAAWYDVAGVQTFSGGTEATACNARTVATLTRAGFAITNSTPGDANPVYLVQYSRQAEPMRAFSKVYSAEGNPQSQFVALLTCDHADQSCPVVVGAALRVAVHYVDPKAADGTEQEAATYDASCREIAREMLFLMQQVNA
jgi:protein-tyrosine-phosphatase